jgi:hypothetical protein
MLDQAAVDRGFEFRAGILIDGHNLLGGLAVARINQANIERRHRRFHMLRFHMVCFHTAFEHDI